MAVAVMKQPRGSYVSVGTAASYSTVTPSSLFRQVGITLLQATKVLRESRGIALLYFRPRHQKGIRGQRHAPAATYPRERPGTHCTGGWVGLRAGLDRCGKSRLHRDSIPGPSSPQAVAIPTQLRAHRSLFKPLQIHDVSILWNTEFMIIFYGCNYEERIN